MLETELTWNDVVCAYPHFCQWIVQKFGPLPDGPIQQQDYERFKAAYDKEHGFV